MSADDCEQELRLMADAITADEAQAWARPSLSQRIRIWFLGDLARQRHVVQEDARALGAKRIEWMGDDGRKVIWSADE